MITEGSVVVGFLDGGEWSASFGLSYRDLCLYDITTTGRIIRPGGLELRSLTGAGGIPGGRNKVARDFLDHTDGEWLFFVDSDMGFARDTVDRLVKSADPQERPVVGALCFALLRHPKKGDPSETLYVEDFTIQPTIYRWVELDEEVGFTPMKDYPRNQVAQCAATGSACVLIHRSALEAVRSRGGDTWYDPIVHPTGLRGGPRTFSEDLSFCVRLAGAGLPVHVDTSIKTSHHKGGIFLTEEMYELSRLIEGIKDVH